MKKYLVVILLVLFSYANNSQTFFQKVLTGELVQDSGYCVNSAWGDYDNDGFQDLAICQGNGNCSTCLYPILLFHNNGNGSFSKITNNIVSQTSGTFLGICWGDYDNDGKLDLFLGSRYGNDMLFHNDGNGQFTRIMTGPEVSEGGLSASCNWCDYDRDGWLDLFVANSNYIGNFLYHNNGNGTFSKITTGPIVNDFFWSRGSAWGDYDNDGWPDLFVVTDHGANKLLYHNNGNGTFSKITNGPIYNNTTWGTQCAWGDYDNDGFLDLVFSLQNSTNVLYHNEGNGSFTLSNALPAMTTGWYYGISWGDYNNDGYLDLHIVLRPGVNYLFKNNNGLSFTNAINEIVAQETGSDGSWADYNNDGKPDLFLTNIPHNILYKNIGPTGNYLICKLRGCQSNSAAIGARIKIKYGNQQQIREVSSGDGNENMLWQHFGLGSVNVIDSVIVLWPYGASERKQVVTNVPANSTITIDECQIGVKQIGSKISTQFELNQNYPNPFNPKTLINYQIPNTGFVKLTVFDVLGNEVSVLVNEKQSTGTHQVYWDASNYPSGVYFYKLTTASVAGSSTGDFSKTKKMVLIK